MRIWQKLLAIAVLSPTLAVAGYIGYLWATYLDETVITGAAYGFAIGASKHETLEMTSNLVGHPHTAVYVSYGPRAGDNFTIAPSLTHIEQLQAHDQWNILLDGTGEFSNSVRLTFRGEKLVELHRHRQYFELP